LVKKSRKTTLNIYENDPAYKKILSFYRIPPTEEISVQEFETFALDRIRVLKEIENENISGLDYYSKIEKVISNYLPLQNAADVRKDVISHFALRFAFCKTVDRLWFINQETALLKWRLGKLLVLEDFLKSNSMEFTKITEEEKQNHYQDLNELLQVLKESQMLKQRETSPSISFQNSEFYKVQFEKATNLIQQRKVLMIDGWAYVEREMLSPILLAQFRTLLSESLSRAAQVYQHVISTFDHIAPLLNHLASMSFGQEYLLDLSKHSKIELGQIDQLAKRSFPMCMRNLHEHLRELHHLKHMGRMQYGLFLKGIGLSLDDALTFWRSEFCKVMGVDQFEKNYRYNIRHNYGKEGRRADYTPYSCVKIIMGHVSAGEHHGCPFRHFDEEHLRTSLRKQHVSELDIESILQLKEQGHYQIACRKHFEVTHKMLGPPVVDIIINHPNQYFDESEKYYNRQQKIQSEERSSGIVTSFNNRNNNNNNNNNLSTSDGSNNNKNNCDGNGETGSNIDSNNNNNNNNDLSGGHF